MCVGMYANSGELIPERETTPQGRLKSILYDHDLIFHQPDPDFIKKTRQTIHWFLRGNKLGLNQNEINELLCGPMCDKEGISDSIKQHQEYPTLLAIMNLFDYCQLNVIVDSQEHNHRRELKESLWRNDPELAGEYCANAVRINKRDPVMQSLQTLAGNNLIRPESLEKITQLNTFITSIQQAELNEGTVQSIAYYVALMQSEINTILDELMYVLNKQKAYV